MKRLQKVQVLLVTGTGDETAASFDLHPGEPEQDRFRWRAGFKPETQHGAALLKKYPAHARKDPLELHYEGVEQAIRTAQARGMQVVSSETRNSPFFQRLRERGKKQTGIDVDKILFGEGFRDFSFRMDVVDRLAKKGMAPSAVVHCGHWKEGCVLDAMRDAQRQYAPPASFLLTGTPTIMSYKARPWTPEPPEVFRAKLKGIIKDGVKPITLAQFRNSGRFKNLLRPNQPPSRFLPRNALEKNAARKRRRFLDRAG